MKFRKKPIVIEARQVPVSPDDNTIGSLLVYVDECVALAGWCGGRSFGS